MCIITAEETEEDIQRWLRISKTNIFTRHTRPGFQAIAYSMSIASSTKSAMILPVPVAGGVGEDALKFIDLSGYPDFFDDLFRACECEYGSFTEDFDVGSSDSEDALLQVHEVGDFEASYVPSMADFGRLDPRFRLPEEVWKQMPDYSDYGFAVFQLKITLAGREDGPENTIHPMAFEFPTQNSEQLYYPTVHVHDGDYHGEADFFHMFYCQRDNARAEFKYQRDVLHKLPPTATETLSDEDDGVFRLFEGYDWFYSSREVAAEVIPLDKCQGIVDPDKKICAMALIGRYANCDLWLGDSV